jgi:hypothetical protein
LNENDDYLEIDDQLGDEEPVVTDPPAKEAEKAGDKASGDKDDLKAIREELTSLRHRVRESDGLAQYWAEQAKAGHRAPAREKVVEEPVDLTEAIASGDNNKIRQAVKKLGFVSEDEVNQRVNSATRLVRIETELLGEFPDLKDKKSDMFLKTQERYAELVSEDPEMKNRPVTMRTAARLAAAEIKGTADKETDRQERVARQSGDRGTRTKRSEGSSDELSPLQKRIVDQMGITEEGYRKRANAGIAMSGLPMRRGR